MNASLLSAVLMSGAPVADGLPHRLPHRLPLGPLGAAAAVVALPPLAEARSCGWFESSWELQHGLAVSDLPDTDAVLAALWFPAWRGATALAAGRLQ